jgi:hypothetical protein
VNFRALAVSKAGVTAIFQAASIHTKHE